VRSSAFHPSENNKATNAAGASAKSEQPASNRYQAGAIVLVAILIEKSSKPPNLDTTMYELKTQTHLKPQDATNVDVTKLTALSPEVVSAVTPEAVEAVGDRQFVSCGFSFCVSFFPYSFADFSSSNH
jgi:hypothetical protein